MSTPQDKLRLLELLYELHVAVPSEKNEAMQKLNVEIDRLRQGTPYSRQQVKDLLYKDGFREYYKRRHLQERSGF